MRKIIVLMLFLSTALLAQSNLSRIVLGSGNFETDPNPTADITFQNDEYITNITDGTLDFGTANLAIGGAITLGSDGTGYDIKFFGATAGNYWLWDASADLVSIVNTSATTTGTDRAFSLSMTQTGASATKILEALRVNIDANVQTGDWVNAIVARVDYGASGSASGGMVAPLCAELSLPESTPSGGAYYIADFEMDAPTNHLEHGNVSYPTAWINFAIYGNVTAIASVEDYAFLFRTDGFTSASGNMIYNNTIRTRIGSSTMYLPLSDAEGEYSTAYLIDVSNTTDASSLTAASIATDGGLAVAKQLYIGDDLDMSVSGTGVYDITLKDGVADALSIVRGTTDIIVFNTSTPGITITPATTITGLLTANGSVAMGDGDYIGVTSNEVITFATAGTITASGADFVVGETAADNITRQVRIIGDADSDGSATTSETLTISLTANATPTAATWGFASTQGAGYTFDKAVGVTGLVTSSAGFVLGDGDYIGVTSNEVITFATAGTITASGADFVVGETAADNVLRQVRIIGDADLDGSATTSETLTISLTQNSTPTLATWGFASTQGAGYTFDKAVNVTGTVTSSAGFILGDGDYIGVTSNETIVFATAGTITASGADFVVGETAADNVLRQVRVIGDADSDGSAITSETLTISLTSNATPTAATWGFASTQGAGYTFDKAIDVTGLITSSAGFVLGDADYIGITSNEIITFAAAGTITASGADFVVGETVADNITRQVRVIGDADSDGSQTTSETLTVALTANATPTSATWGFTSTQGAGYTFDKKIYSSAGVDLGTSQALTGTTGLTIGAGAETVAINSTDWDIDATGSVSGLSKIAYDAVPAPHALFIGADSDNSGSAIPLVGSSWATSQGVAFYADDGGVAQTGYTETFTSRYLLTANITSGDISVAASHPDLTINANYKGTGGLSAIWANTTIKSGKIVDLAGSLGDASGGAFGVDLIGTLADSSNIAGISVGLGGSGTNNGVVTGFRIRQHTGTVNWDGILSLEKGDGSWTTMTQSTGSDAATLTNGPSGTAGDPDVWFKIYVGTDVYVFPAWKL